MPFSGMPAIEEITTRIFATIFKASHDSVTVQKIVWVTPEPAIAHYEHARHRASVSRLDHGDRRDSYGSDMNTS
jgi:hypothetical protein